MPRPFLLGDEETIALGLTIANQIAHVVYAPITDTTITIPQAVEQSRDRKTQTESKGDHA